jgi:hypothetical protein
MDSNTTDTITVDLAGVTTSTSASIWGTETSVDANIYITSSPYTYTGTAPTITLSDDWANGWNQPSGKMSLKGQDADIDINGVSLMDTLRGIQDQLNMLCPDTEMEAEWDQLREIREQYEAKLQECREKSRAWKALKQQG